MSLKQQNFEQTESIYKRVLDVRLEMYGQGHEEVAVSHVNLGHMYLERGDHQQAAITHLLEALPISGAPTWAGKFACG